jgi:hypothetical protein
LSSQNSRLWAGAAVVVGLTALLAGTAPGAAGSRWRNGPPSDPGYFPIAVWCQDPVNAARFKAAGINCYVALWQGPTEEQLAALRAAGMPVICEQNEVGLKHRNDPVIIGWMHGDEPDNAQSLGEGKGYGPPVPAGEIVASYNRIRKADPTRPVLLNLGQGVAWDNWYGRGVRTNHPEDYPGYIRGCDIASFDIYPVVHDSGEVAGNLQFVGRGVDRLVKWTGGKKAVWNCLEASRISNTMVEPTAAQVASEAWMAIAHGSRGLIYFVHQFEPRFVEASLLENPALLAGVTELNRRIRELAPVINSPVVARWGKVSAGRADATVTVMARKHAGATWLIAVSEDARPLEVIFTVRGLKKDAAAAVEWENRAIPVKNGIFNDRLGPWEARIYRLGNNQADRAFKGQGLL